MSRHRMTAGLGLAAALLGVAAAGAVKAGDGKDRPAVYKGCQEASGAVSLGSHHFVVASDEDNILRVYEVTREEPIATIDLDAKLADPKESEAKKRKVDIEASTVVGGVSLWIGSHSRTTKKGKLRPGRFRLFALDVSAEKPGEAKFLGDYRRLLHDMIAADKGWGLGLGAAFGGLNQATSKPGPKDRGGFNIEGLSVLPDGKTVYIGLRNPLSMTRKPRGEALLIPLENPLALVKGEASRATFGRPVRLDLAGRGVRSIEWSPHHKAFLIVAGDWGPNKQPWQLYTWSGGRADAPTRVRTPVAERRLNPEALIVFAGSSQIQLLSDEGGDAGKRRFRSLRLKVD